VLSGEAAKIAATIDADDELAEILAWRIPELIAYQNKGYAWQFGHDVKKLREAELSLGVGRSDLSQTVARQLFKLMAYKDEYEVARLALKSGIADQARDRFGPDAKVSYQLRPPTLEAAGYHKKVSVPEKAATAMFTGLAKTKALRGRKLDPFGHTQERKIERELINSYRDLVTTIVAKLNESNYDEAVILAGLADQVRGYDTVKLANVDRYRQDLAEALDRF
jgi:indolepyruvate ferredoxin oxidoreductase